MKRDSLDSFDKDLIRRVVQNLFSKHMRHISKYKLWKTLHELGFKYKDIDGGRKALVERNDIINQRIHYLRTIKKKREESYDIIYLDEA